MKEPVTLQQAIVYFSDPQRCFDYAVQLRWIGGKVVCPRCAGEKHSFIKTRRVWFCYPCKKQFSVKVGTVMEDSPITLDKWMAAFWAVANCKNGISSHELGRMLGIHQESAWFMIHRIREAMGNSNTDIKIGGKGGPVEMDETFVGGKVKNMHRSKIRRKFHGVSTQGGNGKAVVMGMLERGGQVRATVIDRRIKKFIVPVIAANVHDGSHVITDEATVYEDLSNKDYFHETVNHIEEYVREHIHTNGIENFWALLKRGLNGTYVSVEPFHLDAYVTEQVFRFNNRATKDNPLNDADRFALVMSQVGGKRLTYKQLTGQMAQSPQQA